MAVRALWRARGRDDSPEDALTRALGQVLHRRVTSPSPSSTTAARRAFVYDGLRA